MGKSTKPDSLLNRRIINEVTGCWEFTGFKDKFGYGQISYQNKTIRVNRLAAYFWKNFNLKSNLLICHHCDNNSCFNPEHLFVGTNQENTTDMMKKERHGNQHRRLKKS